MPDSSVPVILGCWADLFELSQFRATRRRFCGPGRWESVRSNRLDWGWSLDSLIVGPVAHVRIYRSGDDVAHADAWFLPGEHVANLLEHVPDEADSVRVLHAAPDTGDPAFAAYTRAQSRQAGAAPHGRRNRH